MVKHLYTTVIKLSRNLRDRREGLRTLLNAETLDMMVLEELVSVAFILCDDLTDINLDPALLFAKENLLEAYKGVQEAMKNEDMAGSGTAARAAMDAVKAAFKAAV